ncbi:MBL fold metallo-hydrolase [Marinithermus hydrothermalis]|uniref:Beta-lactamase domain protein n=1 Tax=Marinithermus hydrothermalis (strain DSM 14884 / JCM 11576 / T1) TaxID=869210 RepID=F2NNW5_MARHT|nr:MBL fold metallo-hydrolase [Marinithermus hydrothermalis]AEB11339.1 beta-lactamase domain protein [Marinithermus hydrothermalis DSM 14884]
MRLYPCGAAGTVTGSAHLVEHQGYRLLLDCGLYQGADEEKNTEPFPFAPREVDAVVLSHAHLDHVGRLPLLVRQGYAGRVYATPPTLRLVPLILEDALGVMTHEHERALRKGLEPPPLLWTEADLQEAVGRLEPLPYYTPRAFGPFTVTLRNAGHIAGSAFVEVVADGKRLVFSGDLGNRRKELLPDPDYPPRADLVLSEGTYGDRAHRPFQSTLEEFAEILTKTLAAGGKVLIPSFAMERAQELLFHIRELEQEGRIPEVPVFVDSPLTTRITEVYTALVDTFSPEVQALYRQGVDPFRPRQLEHVRSVEESKALNDLAGSAVIIAGSGMLSGGRILHHLRHHLPDPKSALVIVGYQPRGGLGARILERPAAVRIYGHEVPVRASVHTLGGFSGHAGQDELLDWLAEEPRVLLVHGELEKLHALGKRLHARGQAVRVAQYGVPVEV